MKNKGFTLIELLATLILISVIAVITMPIVAHYVNDARVSSKGESAHGYVKAVDNAVGMAIIDNTDRIINGVYNVDKNGNLINPKDNNDTLIIDYKGETPTGTVTISYDKVTGATLTFGKTTVKFENEEYHIQK